MLLGQIYECGKAQQGGGTGQCPEGLVLYAPLLAQVQDWGQLLVTSNTADLPTSTAYSTPRPPSAFRKQESTA